MNLCIFSSICLLCEWDSIFKCKASTYQFFECIVSLVLNSFLLCGCMCLCVCSCMYYCAHALLCRNHHETMHLKIHRRSKDNRFVLGLHSMPFRSIPEMITYYLKHNLPIRGAEHISLVQGLPRNSPIYANVHLVDGSS